MALIVIWYFSNTDEGKLPSAWKRVVSKVNSYKSSENCETRMPIGERLAGNTRVIDIKNGILLIETDHPGWIQYLKMYQNFIIKGLQIECPDLNIKSFAFRTKGSEICLHDNYEKDLKESMKSYNEEIEKKDKEAALFFEENDKNIKKDEKNDGKNSLPADLLAKFDSIRQSMLTNDDNK